MRTEELKRTAEYVKKYPADMQNAANLAEMALILLADYKILVDALKAECCCPGETHWVSKEPIWCDPCEALRKVGE